MTVSAGPNPHSPSLGTTGSQFVSPGSAAVVGPGPTAEALRRKHEANWPRDDAPYGNLALRTYRAISWLEQAERARKAENADLTFTMYWIAFNAAYAKDLSRVRSEKDAFSAFFNHLLNLDERRGVICDTVRGHRPDPIDGLLKNRYLFRPFWNHANGRLSREKWDREFAASNEVLHDRTEASTGPILKTLFDRLYMLRNQLVHGGASWQSSLNRDSVKDGARIMAALVPKFIDIMLDFRKAQWGPPYYRSFPNLRLGKREE